MKNLVVILLLLSFWGGAYREGSSPTAENLELTAWRGETLEGVLQGSDDTDGPLRFMLTTEPVKGELLLREDGSFVYTAPENRRGRDYFGYKVCDAEGNASQEATVIIRLERREN